MKGCKKITRIAYFAAFITLLFSFAFSLSGCEEKPPVVKVGITVEKSEPKPYSEAARAQAYAVIGSLLRDYYRERGETVGEAVLSADTDRLLVVSECVLIPEAEYLASVEVLKDFGSELIASAVSILEGDGDEESLSVIGDVYLRLAENADAEFAGAIFYEICLFVYDKLYEEQMSLYESRGDKYLLVMAEQYKAQKDIFVNEIGESNCAGLISLSLFFRGLFVGGALSEGVLDSFSDTELVFLLGELDFSGLTIGAEGYGLLADYYSDTLIKKEETGYFDELLYEANYNGDLTVWAGVTGELLELLTSVKEGITREDVAMLRQGDTEGFISSAFKKFSEEDWRIFEEVSSVSVAKTEYEGVATRFFGEEFIEYRNNGSAITLGELRAAVGTDLFYNALEGYIFGISPAFSYGMRK